MDYYVIKQNENLKDNVDLSKYDITKHKEDKYVCIRGKILTNKLSLDYVTKKVMLDKIHCMSESIKEVFDMFNENIQYRPIVISDTNSKKQVLLWEMDIKSVLNIENKLDREISVTREETENELIFVVYNKLNNLIIIREDIVECILKRSFYGVVFEKVTLV